MTLAEGINGSALAVPLAWWRKINIYVCHVVDMDYTVVYLLLFALDRFSLLFLYPRCFHSFDWDDP